MDFRKAWKVLQVLLLSQLRAAATARNVRSFIRRPLVLVVIDVIAFGVACFGSYVIGNMLTTIPNVEPALRSVLITLPALMLTMILIFGLVLEVSGGSQFAATDTINWLPVSAGEYVFGSVASLITYYSFVPTLILGGTLPISYIFGLLPTWELMAVLSILGMIVSASVLEILRAVLNRFSNSFYKKGGRGAVAARAISGVALLVFVQILFYPTLYEKAIGSISSNIGPYWFVPILWSSVSVSAQLGGQAFTSLAFALLFGLLTASIYTLAIFSRSKYWVPIPAAIRIGTASYAPTQSSLLGLLSPSQLAIGKKDLRGLVRRREMQRLLALPAIFVVSSFVTASSGGLGNELNFLGFFIATMATLFFSIASMGSEGKSIVNLFSHPLSVKDFIVGKGITPVIFNAAFVLLYYMVIGYVSRASPEFIAILIVSSTALVFEITFLGLFLGMRFPMFSESIRASFMSQSAGLIGFPIAIALMGVSVGPLIYSIAFQSGFANVVVGFGVTILVTCIATVVIYRVLLRQAGKFLSELPGQV